MHFAAYISILLPVVTAISGGPNDIHRYKGRQNSESIWLPVDCPPGNSKRHIIENKFDRRYQTGGVYVCTEANWEGICDYAVLPLNQCFDLAMMWVGEIAGFGPDQSNFACTL